MHAGLHVRGFPSGLDLSLFKGEETRCVATMDRSSRLIGAWEKEALPCNKGYACFFLTGGALCGRRKQSMWQFTSNISVSPIMHLWVTGQVLVEIWMPDMESTAARAPITQESHLSQMHAHTDTAVFSVINKKWKHEALASWPLKSSASKSSPSGFLHILFLLSAFLFVILFLWKKTFYWCWEHAAL